MKAVYTLAAFSSAALVFADDDALDAALDALEDDVDPKKFSSIIDMAFHKLDGHPDFAISTVNPARNTRKNFSYMLQDYGCHCFPSHKSIVGGRGKPKDALDEACRALYRCHKCVDIEAPGVCEAEGGYKYQLLAGGAVGCQSPDKKPECKTHQCSCDRAFAETVFDLWTGGAWSFDTNFWLNPRYQKIATDAGTPLFDYNAECQIGANVTPDACCGDAFPNKVPYNSGDKSCCSVVAKPYNAATDICCVDSVQSVGRGCF